MSVIVLFYGLISKGHTNPNTKNNGMSISSKFYLKKTDSDLHSVQDLPFNRYCQRSIALQISHLNSVLRELAYEKRRSGSSLLPIIR